MIRWYRIFSTRVSVCSFFLVYSWSRVGYWLYCSERFLNRVNCWWPFTRDYVSIILYLSLVHQEFGKCIENNSFDLIQARLPPIKSLPSSLFISQKVHLLLFFLLSTSARFIDETKSGQLTMSYQMLAGDEDSEKTTMSCSQRIVIRPFQGWCYGSLSQQLGFVSSTSC